MMLANRAPTLLLRILLDILNAMNRSSSSRRGRKRSSTLDLPMDVDGPAPAAPASARN